jgi:hypothetical protein
MLFAVFAICSGTLRAAASEYPADSGVVDIT